MKLGRGLPHLLFTGQIKYNHIHTLRKVIVSLQYGNNMVNLKLNLSIFQSIKRRQHISQVSTLKENETYVGAFPLKPLWTTWKAISKQAIHLRQRKNEQDETLT